MSRRQAILWHPDHPWEWARVQPGAKTVVLVFWSSVNGFITEYCIRKSFARSCGGQGWQTGCHVGSLDQWMDVFTQPFFIEWSYLDIVGPALGLRYQSMGVYVVDLGSAEGKISKRSKPPGKCITWHEANAMQWWWRWHDSDLWLEGWKWGSMQTWDGRYVFTWEKIVGFTNLPKPIGAGYPLSRCSFPEILVFEAGQVSCIVTKSWRLKLRWQGHLHSRIWKWTWGKLIFTEHGSKQACSDSAFSHQCHWIKYCQRKQKLIWYELVNIPYFLDT